MPTETEIVQLKVSFIENVPAVYSFTKNKVKYSKVLFEQGISAEVINIHTIKPLDEEIILKSVSKTGCIVSAEEHNYLGGLGESISRVLSKNFPLPQEFVATKDTFGESGTPAQLMEKYGLNASSIVEKAKKVISRKES